MPNYEAMQQAILERARNKTSPLSLQGELFERKLQLIAAVEVLENIIPTLSRDARNRALLEGDILRYEAHCNLVYEGKPDVMPLWQATAIKAAGDKVELQLIENTANCSGFVTDICDKYVHIMTSVATVYRRHYGHSVVKKGDEVGKNTVISKAPYSHAIVRELHNSHVVVGYANRNSDGIVDKVLVEGKGNNAKFTLLSAGIKPRYIYGLPVRGVDRLERLMKQSLALCMRKPTWMLREAADAAYGPLPSKGEE
jgi:hypothetical protein